MCLQVLYSTLSFQVGMCLQGVITFVPVFDASMRLHGSCWCNVGDVLCEVPPTSCYTITEGNREKLVQCGGVPVFVHLLTSNNTDIQFYSAASISNLAVHG